MKREDFNRTLRQMEQCRELQMEAESPREAKKYAREYDQMFASIRPYIGPKAKKLDD